MKKSILIISAFVFFLFASNTLFAQMEIQTGKYKFDPTISNFSLAYGGDQERVHLLTITFPKPFKTVPQVMIGVTKYDGDRSSNTRFDVSVTSVSKTTIQIQAKTWGGTKIYLLAGEWIAIGE